MTIVVLMILIAAPLWAQKSVPDANSAQAVSDVSFNQKLNSQIPLDLRFVDEEGRSVKLGSVYGEKPVILILAYYGCPSLCGEVLNGVVKAMRPLSFNLGDEFDIVTVSIDPTETPDLAKEKRDGYLKSYGRDGVEHAWHFLTGEKSAIDSLAGAVGFRYVFDERSGDYAHAGGIIVTTPQGRTAQYFPGIEYSARDLKFALMESSEERIGSLVDAGVALCFQYDPTTGRYGFAIMRTLQIAGSLLVLAIGIFIVRSIRRDKRRRLDADDVAAVATSALHIKNGISH